MTIVKILKFLFSSDEEGDSDYFFVIASDRCGKMTICWDWGLPKQEVEIGSLFRESDFQSFSSKPDSYSAQELLEW